VLCLPVANRAVHEKPLPWETRTSAGKSDEKRLKKVFIVKKIERQQGMGEQARQAMRQGIY
jgi:hypothetical protein